MSTFNAGAIEATLALGRSSWTADLKKTQAEIQKLEQTSITIGVTLDTDNARVQMNNMEALLAHMDEKEYAPRLDLLVSDANEALSRFEARLEDLDRRTVRVGADVDAAAAIATLESLEDLMDDIESDPINIDVEVRDAAARNDLNDIERQANRLDAMRVDLQVGADTAGAEAAIADIEQRAAWLDHDPVTIAVKADVDDAMTGLIQVMSLGQIVESNGINIDVDVDGYGTAIAQLATLEAQVALLDGKDIDIDVDADDAVLKGLVGSGSGGGGGGRLGLLRMLIYAIILLSPILTVALSSGTAAIVAFAGAVSGAVGPLAVFTAGIVGLIMRYNELVESGEALPPHMQAFSDAIDGVKDAWNTFLDAIEVPAFDLMTDAVNLLAGVIPTLSPLFLATAEMLDGVLASVQGFVNSSEYNEMIDFFSTHGVDMLESFLVIGGNLILFFGRLFDAISPFTEKMMQGLEDLTASWAAWADELDENEGFQNFMEHAEKYGPMVLDMLGSLLAALLAIGDALEPFAGPMLEGLTFLFDTIAEMPTEVLTVFIGALAGLWLGLNVLGPIVTTIIPLLSALAGVIGAISAPVWITIAAIVAIGAALYLAWTQSEDFRNNVKEIWEDLKTTVSEIVADIKAAIEENWGPMKEWAKETWEEISGAVRDALAIVKIHVTNTIQLIKMIWQNFGDDIIQFTKGSFQIIAGIFRGMIQILGGIFKTIRGLLTGDWKMMGEGLKQIGRGFITAIVGMFRGFMSQGQAIWSAIGKVLSAAWSATMTNLKGLWNGFKSWATGKWNEFKGLFDVKISVGDIFGSIKDKFKDVINTIIGWWNGLSFGIPGWDPPGPGPKIPAITISTPNIGYLAKGGYITDPGLFMVGEGGEPEIVAPESKMIEIVREYGGGSSNIDYGMLGRAVAYALSEVLGSLRVKMDSEDLDLILSRAGASVKVDAGTNPDEVVRRMVSGISFELRRMGFGGKANV